ncbi:MAG: c-type cytochrome [Candidatus Binatia bacterium]
MRDLGTFVLALAGLFIVLGWYVTALQGGGVQAATSGVSAERGETIFWDTGPVKGTCRNCHSIGDRGNMKRCPNLGESALGPPIGERAARRAEERHAQTGKPYTRTDYLVECIANPSAYVVQGFPDHLMPLVYTGQIDLAPEDVMSVIAYLQSIGGEVDLPAIAESMSRYGQAIFAKESGKTSGAKVRRIDFPYPEWEVLEPEQIAEYQARSNTERKAYLAKSLDDDQIEMLADIEEEWIEDGRKVFRENRCWQCHGIAGEDFGAVEPGKVGPELSGIGAIQTREYLLESILNPDALIVPPVEEHSEDGRSKMPSFADLLSTRDLLRLVVYLSSLTGAPPPAEPEEPAPASAVAGHAPRVAGGS